MKNANDRNFFNFVDELSQRAIRYIPDLKDEKLPKRD